MSGAHPAILSAAMLEDGGAVLAAHRRAGRPPFEGCWLPPLTPVRPDETAEDAVRRHAVEQFGASLSDEAFADTVYVVDPNDQARYVANVFRAAPPAGLRFRNDGDYDDARWLAPAELALVQMPGELRDSLVRLLTEPRETYPPVATQSAPLAERDALAATSEPEPDDTPPPDNRAGWDAIANAYQREYFGDRDAGRLKWTRGVFEDDLRLLGDVRGMRALVLGCGGGQDVVALAKMGAVAVGIDHSAAQLRYARGYAQRHGDANISFVECPIEDLSRFADASFDVVVSIHALGFVEDAAGVLRECARVLKRSGVLGISVPHPFDQTLSDGPPYVIERSYWQRHMDWDWKFEEASGRLRDWRRTVSEWVNLMVDAGFIIERMDEPYLGGLSGDDAKNFDMTLAKLMPWALILKARRR